MRSAAKAVAGVGLWLLTILVLRGLVWLSVTSSPTRLGAIATVAADDPAGPPVVVVAGAAAVPGADDGTAAASASAEAAAREWVDVPADPSGVARPTGAATPTPAAHPTPTTASTSAPAATPAAAPAAVTTSAPAVTRSKAPASPAAAPAPAPVAAAQPTPAPATSRERTTPDRGVPAAGPPAGATGGTAAGTTAGTTVAFLAPAAQLLVTCSADGLGDLRAITGPGWGGRWTRTGPGRVVLWFGRDRRVEVLVVSCLAGAPSVRDVTAGLARWSGWAAGPGRSGPDAYGPPFGGAPFGGPGR